MTTSPSEQQVYEDLTEFQTKFKRRLVPYVGQIYAVYSGEALTGFLLHLADPKFGKFESTPAVLVPLSEWIMLKTLTDATVTTSLILVRGKDALKVGYWQPKPGLKYAVRDVDGVAMLHVTASDFKDL